MGLSASGLTLPSGSELLDAMVAEFESLTGLVVDPTDTSDQFVMVVFTIMAEQLGDAMDTIQAVYDGMRVDTAEGLQLEDAAYMVGVEPDPATYSSATVSLAGVSGTIVPSGSVVEGGGPLDTARWTTSDDVVIPGDVVVVAQEAGPITAVTGQIDKIVTGVTGWSTVTNAAAAAPGKTREGGQSLKRRRRAALQAGAAASSASIRSSLLNLDYIDECVVIQNTSNVAAVVSGKSLDPNAVWIFLTPDSLTDDQKTAVAALVHRKTAAGTELMSSGGATEVIKHVTDAGGSTGREIKWDFGAQTPTDVDVTVTLEPGYTLDDVTAGIEDAMTNFFAGLGMGDVLREYDLIVATAAVDGIADVAFVASIGGLPYTPSIDETVTLGTVTVV